MRSGLACAITRAALVIALATTTAVVVLAPVEARADEPAGPSAKRDVHEARAFLDATYGEMRMTSVRVRDQLRVTRRRGTPRQVICVDEALSRADVGLRHARALGDELLAAHARGDADSVRLLRRQLEELRLLTRFAGEQATKCAPTAVGASSAAALPVATSGPAVTTVRMDVDPRIPRID